MGSKTDRIVAQLSQQSRDRVASASSLLPSQPINKDFECRDPSEQLVVRRHKVPRCPLGRSLFYHIFYRDFVVRPAFPIAEVFVGKLPAFERIIYSVLEPANLLASRDVQKNLRDAD